MRRLRSLVAAGIVGVLAASYALAQTTLPGQIGDMVYNSLTLNNNLTVTGTSTLTGAVTAPAGITANVTGNVTGTATGAVVGSTGTFSSTLGVTGVTTPIGGIAAAAGSSVSPRLLATGGYPAIISTSGNDSTPSITETYVTEIWVPANMTITGVALFNGSVITGNVTVGLATAAGAPIAAAKSASTAGSGTDAYQRVPFATPYAAIGPATYYMQVQYSSASARYNTHTVGNFGCLVQTSQVYGTLASFTPPTTFVTNVCNMASLY